MSGEMRVKVTKDGPYIVYGEVPLKEEVIKRDKDGKADKWEEKKKYPPVDTYDLCRCGRSNDRPFCTGGHLEGFNGAETAVRKKYDETAQVCVKAEGVELLQDTSLCVAAGFCHGKYYVDKMVRKEETLDIALQQTYDCPGGSLLIKIDGEPQEPQFEKGISVTSLQKPGPLWVKGGIQVESSDGYKYEARNRVALCSCGKSKHKPFCDASHVR